MPPDALLGVAVDAELSAALGAREASSACVSQVNVHPQMRDVHVHALDRPTVSSRPATVEKARCSPSSHLRSETT